MHPEALIDLGADHVEEMSISSARSFLERAGARVRMTGGGLVDDPRPQIEAKLPGEKVWRYVAQVVEEEVSAMAVYYWVDQNILHKAHPAP